MTKLSINRKGEKILQILNDLFPVIKVPLEHHDHYSLLIAVLLSAQCTDERVNKVTPQLFSLASTPGDMMMIPIERIQEIIRPCGLSSRKAKAIQALSSILFTKYKSRVPDNSEDLEALPGVGHKTASVIMAQAFNIPAFPVDTHIHRLAYRWGLSSGKNVVTTENDLKKVFPESTWNRVHLQMIYYGRTYCKARGHQIEDCIICSKFGKKERSKKGNPKPDVL